MSELSPPKKHAGSPTKRSAELKEAGLFRILQPARFGGYELDPRTFLEVAMIIGAACGSTGWVYSVIGVHNWQLALMPEQAQEDVWGERSGRLDLLLVHARGVTSRSWTAGTG